MLSIYIFATIVGGLLLTISLLGGGHHGGTDADHGGDLGHSTPDVSADSADHHSSGGHESDTPGLLHSVVPSVLSTRLWTHFLAFGGLTGVLLRLVAHLGEPATALLSGTVGLASGLYARMLISKAAAMGSGGTVLQKELPGHLGTVLVPFGPAQTGKVRVQVKDETVDVLATSEEGHSFDLRQQVLILGFRDGRALVARAEVDKE